MPITASETFVFTAARMPPLPIFQKIPEKNGV
jgi:hypothetical protein